MDEKRKAIEEVVKSIEKTFGKGTIMKLGDSKEDKEIEWIPSGSIALDCIVGQGFPRGRIIELYGPEGGGKSSIGLLLIRASQKLKGICAYIDAEGAFDPKWTSRLGVNVDDLYLVQPDYGEQALEVVDNIVRSGGFDVIVVDSVAALLPKEELEGTMEDTQQRGLQAKMIGKALRKLAQVVNKTKTVVIFVNQLRQKPGVVYGNPEYTPGGEALKFYSSVRMRISRVSKSDIEYKGEIVGHRIHVVVQKNKVSAPFKKTDFFLCYNKGVDNEESLCNISIEKGIVVQQGPSYIYGENKWVGIQKFVESVRNDNVLYKGLCEKLGVHKGYFSSIEDIKEDD